MASRHLRRSELAGGERRTSRVNRQGLAVLMAVSTLVLGAGGALLVARAWNLPPPAAPAFVEVPGRVVAIATETCGTHNRRHTCYRPVVDYVANGQTAQTASRSRYRPAPYQVGDSAPVLLGDDGSVWLKQEWDSRHQAKLTEVRREKTMFYALGSLLLGSALLGAILAVAVLFAQDP